MLSKIKKPKTICEYDKIYFSDNVEDANGISQKTFEQLEYFILENKKGDDALELLKIRSEKAHRKIIQAQSYVGVIQFKNGFTLEILPKIYNIDRENEVETRKLLLKMLKYLKDFPFKTHNTALLKNYKMPLLEIFITMFLDEVELLVKRGLRSDYIQYENNEKFMKGKLLFNKHIKENFVHKERFYVEYSLYSQNRPENRIIKSTLKFLKAMVYSEGIKSQIKKLEFMMKSIDESKNIDKDLQKCKSNRLMQKYEKIVNWCRVFLKGESFANFTGKNVVISLLYPMEKIFEDFISKVLRNVLKYKEYGVQGKPKRFRLLKKENEKFLIKPDIFIQNNDNTIYLIDAKWKMLNLSAPNFGLSIADLYQLYSYANVYYHRLKEENIKIELFLVYPMNENFTKPVILRYPFAITSVDEDIYNLPLTLVPIDLSILNKKGNDAFSEHLKERFHKNE